MVNDAMEKMQDDSGPSDTPGLLKSLLSEESLKRDEIIVLVNDLLTGGVESVSTNTFFQFFN